MKKSVIIKPIVEAAVFALFFLVLGSSAKSADLVETGNVILELVPTGDETITSAHVYETGRELVISGRVHSLGDEPLEGGHVYIEIIKPDGTAVKECAHYFKPIRRKLDLTAPFDAHLRPFNLPKGAIVRLTYHHKTSPQEIISRCDL